MSMFQSSLIIAQAAPPTLGSGTGASYLLILILLVAGFIFYFIPAIVARRRKHSNATAITVLNFLLGWTFLGWIGALVWAFTGNSAAKQG